MTQLYTIHLIYNIVAISTCPLARLLVTSLNQPQIYIFPHTPVCKAIDDPDQAALPHFTDE